MTVWKRVDINSKYGVAVCHFHKKGKHLLRLDVGDILILLEECDGGWYHGYASSNKGVTGIFPKNYVCLKEATILKAGSLETVTLKEPPIAQEIISVVREWNIYWRNLYVEGAPEFEVVQGMINSLVNWRKEILSRKMTNEQMKDLKQKVSAKIDTGNALLGLDLVVRDEEGNVLNPETASVVRLFREHTEVADRLKREKSHTDKGQESQASRGLTFNLYVMLRNFVCRVDDVEILVNLYDAKDMTYICENYIVKWEREKLSRDPDILNSIRVVFTDLDAKDRAREKVFLVFQIIRLGVMDLKDIDDKKQTRGLRRPFGAAAMDVTDWLRGLKADSEDEQHFIPFLQCNEKEFMDSCVRKAVLAREINHKGQGLWVSLKLLQGDMKQIREDFPHLVQPSTTVIRKMGFPEVIMPGDVRNDIYVTIVEGEFNRGSKTADKNVEVTMLVCNKKGESIGGVINTGCGMEGQNNCKTLIYYHEDKPKWSEIVKVALSIEEEFRGLHLKFLFKHKSRNETKDKNEKPFAMAFVKLLNKNGTTLKDEEHDLLLYKIDSKKDHDSKHSHPYLDLPSTVKDLETPQLGSSKLTQQIGMSGGTHSRLPKIPLYSGPYSLSYRDSFKISTFVCSTKLTHNVDLLGLLKWQQILNDTTALKKHLEQLMKVDGEEIVKFLQDLLDSLFYILMQNTISDLYDNLVFDALIYIIGLVSDSRYFQFRPILDAYIETNFSITTAYNKLMVILKEYVDNANEDTQHEVSLLRAMKSLEYIFKFIIKSRELFARLNENKGKQQFEIMLKQLVQAIGGMMLYQSDRTVRAQGYALRNMPSTITDVLKVFNPVELSHLFVEFLNHVPKNRLRIQKIKCIEDLVQTDLFAIPECREVLLPMMLEHIGIMMIAMEEISACVKVLCNIMDKLFSPAKKLCHDSDIHTIMKLILRTVIQTTIKTHSGDCVSVLLSILRQMSETHYTSYINSFLMLSDLEDFLVEIMMLFQNLINSSIYQTDWIEMIMLQNSIILRALRFFAHTINQKFSSPFQYQLWNNFFHCAISFLTQEHLQLENFSNSKRNKIISRYKDMRREMGFEIRSLWFSLGVNKSFFIPELVGPLLEMTLIPETELRKATIPIFFDMMLCEFNQSVTGLQKGVVGPKGNFKQVENEMINQIDVLVEGGRGDEQYVELLRDTLTQACNGKPQVRDQGLQFVETITKLLQRLLEYRHITQDEIKDHRMSCIVNLLDFYNNIGRQEMYIRYLHKLCNMHLEVDNFTEAAHSLMLHSKLLDWTDESLTAILKSDRFPEAKTHRELKEMFYHQIIKYFENGKMWESGIDLCKELASLYENELFDYEKLSWILRRQAELYEDIMREMRPDPEYFRVGYYGKGFPSFLQNKELIYRGKDYERLQDFNARMQTLFPNAELMKTLTAPSEEIKESQNQYLQINAVTPVMQLHQKFHQKQVSERILKYYNFNQVQLFTYSRRIDEGGSDISNMWLEKTNMTTSSPLPGILCWFPVEHTIVYKVSPIENAIETLESSNKKLVSAIEHQVTDSKARIDQLSMLLNGIVDAAVMGGITNWKHFYADDYGSSERDMEFVIKLKDLTKHQAVLLHDAMYVHKRKVSSDLQKFHDHLEQRFADWLNLIESEYKLKVKAAGPENSTLTRLKSASSLSLSRISDLFPNSPSQEGSAPASPAGSAKPGSSRSQSVFVRQDKPDKTNSPGRLTQPKVGNRKFKRSSQISVTSGSDQSTPPDSNRNSLENPIELNEQITPRRPPRPEVEKERRNSRPMSGQFRLLDPMVLPGGHSNSTPSLATASATFVSYTENGEEGGMDEPPPLPGKTNVAAHSDMRSPPAGEPPSVPPRVNSMAPKTPRKSKPLPSQPSSDSDSASLPPKLPTYQHSLDE